MQTYSSGLGIIDTHNTEQNTSHLPTATALFKQNDWEGLAKCQYNEHKNQSPNILFER